MKGVALFLAVCLLFCTVTVSAYNHMFQTNRRVYTLTEFVNGVNDLNFNTKRINSLSVTLDAIWNDSGDFFVGIDDEDPHSEFKEAFNAWKDTNEYYDAIQDVIKRWGYDFSDDETLLDPLFNFWKSLISVKYIVRYILFMFYDGCLFVRDFLDLAQKFLFGVPADTLIPVLPT